MQSVSQLVVLPHAVGRLRPSEHTHVPLIAAGDSSHLGIAGRHHQSGKAQLEHMAPEQLTVVNPGRHRQRPVLVHIEFWAQVDEPPQLTVKFAAPHVLPSHAPANSTEAQFAPRAVSV